MADKTTSQAGDISLAATWGGVLPTAGQTAALGHACTLATGLTFTALSLDLAGYALVTTGTGTINASIIALETLNDTAATGLVINGNIATTANVAWTAKGITSVNGTVTCGGDGGGPNRDEALIVQAAAHLAATETITATTYSAAEKAAIRNYGTITANLHGIQLNDGIGVKNEGTINGDVNGYSENDVGVYNYIGATINGDVTGESPECTGINNVRATINGDVLAINTGPTGVGLNNIGGTINGDVSCEGGAQGLRNVQTPTSPPPPPFTTWDYATINGNVTATTDTGEGVLNAIGGTINGAVSGVATGSGIGVSNEAGATINLVGLLVATSDSGQNLVNAGTIQNGPISSHTKLKYLPQVTPGNASGLPLQAATGTVQSDAAAALTAFPVQKSNVAVTAPADMALNSTVAKAATAVSSTTWTNARAAKLDSYPYSVTPLAVTVSAGAVTENKLTAYQRTALGPYVWTIVDSSSNPVSLAGKTVRFNVSEIGTATPAFVYSSTGSEITISGSSNNVVTLSADDTNTGRAGLYQYALLNYTDDTLLNKGTLKIVPTVAST